MVCHVAVGSAPFLVRGESAVCCGSRSANLKGCGTFGYREVECRYQGGFRRGGGGRRNGLSENWRTTMLLGLIQLEDWEIEDGCMYGQRSKRFMEMSSIS